jgi:hypothetical protein
MRIFGYRTISFVAGVAYLAKGMVGLGIAALGFAHYSSRMFGGLSIPLTASVALLVVAAVNFFGVSPTAKVIISIFFTNLVLLLIFVGFSIPSVKVDNFTPLLGNGFTGILSGAAVFFLGVGWFSTYGNHGGPDQESAQDNSNRYCWRRLHRRCGLHHDCWYHAWRPWPTGHGENRHTAIPRRLKGSWRMGRMGHHLIRIGEAQAPFPAFLLSSAI